MAENKKAAGSGNNRRNNFRKPNAVKQSDNPAPQLQVYPLGGLGEVGKNMTLYECNGEMILVDCGSVFPDDELYGIDLVIPDMTFVEENFHKIKGMLVTHGHEDHIGSIPYLLKKFDLPIYGTRLTCGLIRNKLEEFNLAGSVIGAYTIQAITTTLLARGVSTAQAPVFKAIIVILIVVIQAPPVKNFFKKLSAKKAAVKEVA